MYNLLKSKDKVIAEEEGKTGRHKATMEKEMDGKKQDTRLAMGKMDVDLKKFEVETQKHYFNSLLEKNYGNEAFCLVAPPQNVSGYVQNKPSGSSSSTPAIHYQNQ